MTLLNRFKEIKTFVFDVDGVLTDGSVWTLDTGEMLRRTNIKDGYALQLAVKKGYRVVVISGGSSPSVKVRLERLGIADVYLNITNKKETLEEYALRHNLLLKEMLFMGDDIPDYSVMKLVGLASAPADAAPEIKQIASYISPVKGGHGCVRDVIEKVLKLNNDWHMETEIASK